MLQGQRYPIYVQILPTSHKFNSISLHDCSNFMYGSFHASLFEFSLGSFYTAKFHDKYVNIGGIQLITFSGDLLILKRGP